MNVKTNYRNEAANLTEGEGEGKVYLSAVHWMWLPAQRGKVNSSLSREYQKRSIRITEKVEKENEPSMLFARQLSQEG